MRSTMCEAICTNHQAHRLASRLVKVILQQYLTLGAKSHIFAPGAFLMPVCAISALFAFSVLLLCVFRWLGDLDRALDAAFKGDGDVNVP